MRRGIATMLAAAMLVGVTALPAAASHKSNDRDFVDFIAQQAEKRKGNFNVIGQVVLALADAGVLTAADVEALSTAKLTAFLPTDFAFRRLAADISGKKVWKVKESQVIPILTGALDLDTIGAVVKYHIYPGGKVDYRTALKLDKNKRNGTDVFITMYSGGELGIDRRGGKLQLDDAGTAGFGSNNPYVIRPTSRPGTPWCTGSVRSCCPSKSVAGVKRGPSRDGPRFHGSAARSARRYLRTPPLHEAWPCGPLIQSPHL